MNSFLQFTVNNNKVEISSKIKTALLKVIVFYNVVDFMSFHLLLFGKFYLLYGKYFKICNKYVNKLHFNYENAFLNTDMFFCGLFYSLSNSGKCLFMIIIIYIYLIGH